MSSLYNQVLEMEPWNEERHVSGRGAVWRYCGLRAPGFLKNSDLEKARLAVQQPIFRMARQLNDPMAGYSWKSYPDVKQRVEKIEAKLANEYCFTHQRQGHDKPEKPNLATVEAVHASPAQPATVQQHQQQGHEKPEKCSLLQLAFRSYVAMAKGVPAAAASC